MGAPSGRLEVSNASVIKQLGCVTNTFLEWAHGSLYFHVSCCLQCSVLPIMQRIFKAGFWDVRFGSVTLSWCFTWKWKGINKIIFAFLVEQSLHVITLGSCLTSMCMHLWHQDGTGCVHGVKSLCSWWNYRRLWTLLYVNPSCLHSIVPGGNEHGDVPVTFTGEVSLLNNGNIGLFSFFFQI